MNRIVQPAKKHKKKNGWWTVTGLCLVFLMIFSVTSWTATLDHEGYDPDIIVVIKEVNFKGHTFTRGLSTRTYLFETHAESKEYYKGHLENVTPLTFKEKVIWDGYTHRLMVHTTEKNGYAGDAVYTCGDMDPLLSASTPKLGQVSFADNWKGPRPVVWGGESPIERWRDSISSGRRFSLILEALAKSMRVEVSSSKVKSPPGDVMLMVHTATDVQGPKGWKVEFDVEKKDAPAVFDDIYGHEVNNRHGVTLLRGTTFYILRHLKAGEYSFWTRMATTLTGNYISSGNDVIFNVVNNLNAPAILVPGEGEKIGKSSTVDVRIAGNPAADAVILEVQYSKLAKQIPYNKLREIKKGGYPFFLGGVWKCSCGIGDKLGVPLEGDFRIRARMFYQDKPFGAWSKWRHFHAGKELVAVIERPLRIISPAEGKTYTNEIPVKISLPDNMGENARLTLTWSWTPPTKKTPSGIVIHSFSHVLMSKTVAVSSGKLALTTYQGSMKVEKLFKREVEVAKDTAGGGSFGLRANLKADGQTDRTFYCSTFYGGTLGTPAQKDGEKKKDLSYHMNVPTLGIVPFKTRYRPFENIAIRLRHAGKGKPEFQVRFRPPTGKSYSLLLRVPHRFTSFGDETTLHVKFREPGQYQIRFHPGTSGRWSTWHSFEVVDPHLTGIKKMKPVNANRLKVYAAPVIETPKQHQAFMLAGREVRVTAKIHHAAGAKVKIEIQRGAHGNFQNTRLKVDKHKGKTESTFTLHVTKTGDYRIRAKLTSVSSASWSTWREFKVDRANLNLIHKIKPKSPAKKQATPSKRIHLNSPGIKIK